MGRAVIALAIAIVIALDWPALDDITTGFETSLVGEYATLIAGVPAVGMLWLWLRKKRGGALKPESRLAAAGESRATGCAAPA